MVDRTGTGNPLYEGLTPIQIRFVQEYLVDLCGSAAAIRAGYAKKTAANRASILLAKPAVKMAVRRAQEARAKAVGVTAERVLSEIAAVAFSDVQNHVDIDDGTVRMKSFDEMPEGSSRVIETLTDTKDAKGTGKIGVKLWDKVKALEMLARHLGLYSDSVRLTGAGGEPAELTIRVINTKE